MTKMAKLVAIITLFVAIGLSFRSFVVFEQHCHIDNNSDDLFTDVLNFP